MIYYSKPIAVIVDGQGGGIGKLIVEKLKKEIPELHIRALGTNSLATTRMMKAGADDGATGENAVIVNVEKAAFIVGPIGILTPNSILGELTPKMVEAIGKSSAIKILIPIDKCNTRVVLLSEGSLTQYIDRAVEMIRETMLSNLPR